MSHEVAGLHDFGEFIIDAEHHTSFRRCGSCGAVQFDGQPIPPAAEPGDPA